MTPRLNRQARQHLAHATLHGKRRGFRVWRAAAHPSPAEKRKARHHAWKQSMRKHGIAVLRTLGRACANDGWPEHRGTTAQQLTAMHLEAEDAQP